MRAPWRVLPTRSRITANWLAEVRASRALGGSSDCSRATKACSSASDHWLPRASMNFWKRSISSSSSAWHSCGVPSLRLAGCCCSSMSSRCSRALRLGSCVTASTCCRWRMRRSASSSSEMSWRISSRWLRSPSGSVTGAMRTLSVTCTPSWRRLFTTPCQTWPRCTASCTCMRSCGPRPAWASEVWPTMALRCRPECSSNAWLA